MAFKSAEVTVKLIGDGGSMVFVVERTGKPDMNDLGLYIAERIQDQWDRIHENSRPGAKASEAKISELNAEIARLKAPAKIPTAEDAFKKVAKKKTGRR